MEDWLHRWVGSGRRVLICLALLAVALPVASRWSAMATGDLYEVRLSPAQQVPPVRGSTGQGRGVFIVREDRSVEGGLETSGIDGTTAHLHEGGVGRVGPVLVPLTKEGDTFVVPPDTRLTAGQVASLRAGRVYVNVRSVRHPDGELRAQLTGPVAPQ